MEISDQELRALVRDAIARHGRATAGAAERTGVPSHCAGLTAAMPGFRSLAEARTMVSV